MNMFFMYYSYLVLSGLSLLDCCHEVKNSSGYFLLVKFFLMFSKLLLKSVSQSFLDSPYFCLYCSCQCSYILFFSSAAYFAYLVYSSALLRISSVSKGPAFELNPWPQLDLYWPYPCEPYPDELDLEFGLRYSSLA